MSELRPAFLDWLVLSPRLIRFIRNVLIAGLALLLFLAADHVGEISLMSHTLFSGWALLALVLGLGALNARKRLSGFRLGSAAAWVEIHSCAGVVALVLFLVHVGRGWPSGRLDVALASAFVLTALSGVLGLALSRLVPPRLTTHGQTVLYERIPALGRELAVQVRDLVARSFEQTRSSAIADLYAERLARYFDGPSDFLAHLAGSERPEQARLNRVLAVRRYADPVEAALLDELVESIRVKGQLDFQYAHQWILKGWLFVHIGATVSLLVLAACHVLVVYAFRATAG